MADEGESPMDLDLDAVHSSRPAVPETRPFQTKGKGKAEPVSEAVKKQDEGHRGVSSAIVKDKEEQEQVPPLVPDSGPASTSGEAMEVEYGADAEEDTVVEELDVFFNPAPFDEDNLTLSSSKVVSPVTNYAIGVLKDRKVFLNSFHAMLQLRPSMKYLDAGKHNQSAWIVENTSTNNGEPAKSNQAAVVSKENADDAEPWMSLKYKARDRDSANEYLGKMVVKTKEHIQFTMNSPDYLDLLGQGTITHNKRAKVHSIRVLLSMPLDERLELRLSKFTVNRFKALVHLAPEISEEDLPKILASHANLVQGVWVTKSSLVYPDEKAKSRSIRDYILSLFSKSPIITKEELERYSNDDVRDVMVQLAHERHTHKDRKWWKFKEATDFSFIKKYPDIVKEHECFWSACKKESYSLSGFLGNQGQRISQNVNNPTSMAPGKVDINPHKSKDSSTSLGSTDMPDETQEHLQKSLTTLFQKQKVRSFNSIVHGLRDITINFSTDPKNDEPKSSKILDAFKRAASMPPVKLDPVISKVAVKVHGVYVLSTLGNRAIDPIRNVVIDLFRSKEANVKLTKQDILGAVRNNLKKDIKDSEFKQAMHELGDCIRGSWMLKSGD